MSLNVAYKGPRVLRANQLFKAELQINLGEGLQPGGKIAVAARHTSDFGDAQTDNFVSVSATKRLTIWPSRISLLGGAPRRESGPAPI